MNNNDNSDAGERNSQSPVWRNKLPPGYEGNRSKKMPSRTLGRKKSRNLMTAVGSSPKHASLGRDKYPNLPTESQKRIDYVIVYENKSVDDVTGKKEQRKLKKKLELREKFLKSLAYDEIVVKEDVIGDHVFMQLHVPFHRLCEQAEKIKLELPLKGCEIYKDEPGSCACWHEFQERHLVTDDEVDFVSAPYQVNKHHLFDNHENPDTFFRPATRCFLAHDILINSDIRKVDTGEEQDDPLAKKGLPYLLHKNVYQDAFILHDESKGDPIEEEQKAVIRAVHGDDVNIEDPDCVDTEGELLMPDTRQELMETWGRFCPQKYQPLWKIRNYFGEKIALYFAWVGVWIETLWIPTAFGVAVFLYGLYLSSKAKAEVVTVDANSNSSVISRVTALVQDSLGVIKESFDNDVTPFYALGICLWGTVFLEVWKRRNATLAYQWDVDSFEDNEPDRPQFIGTRVKPDPIVLGEETWYYPMPQQCMKFFASFIFLIVMVIVVFIAAGSVILYRVFMTISYCESMTSVNCLLVTTIASSLLNAVAIMILGKLYDIIAIKLTDWENHRTQTRYDDALIIKLFAFQFANSYTSCFYIAFFRGRNMENGLFGLGPEYQDSCGEGSCMAMLSFQVLILMLIKPLPKLLKDIILPWLKKLWRTRRFCRKQNKVSDGKVKMKEYLERERLKPDVGDFTLGEYTEKCIVYGFLMLFAASFPLAPLIAILISLIDIRVDARRLLWMYRRPVSVIAQDIGMWYAILQFLNFVGVVTNGFIIAFTSTWGYKYTITEKLWIVIIFEHLVFGVKFLIDALIPDIPESIVLVKKRHIVFFIKLIMAAIIPDVPAKVNLAIKREKYQVARIMGSSLENSDDPGPGTGRRKRASHRDAEAEAQKFFESDEVGLLPPKNKEKRKKKKKAARPDILEEEETNDGNDYRKNSPKLQTRDDSVSSDVSNDRTQLSYDADGNTYIGGSDKFPQLRTKSPQLNTENDIPIPEIQHGISRRGRDNDDGFNESMA